MATIAENIDTIKNTAADLDTIIADFRAAKATIDAAEAEIRQARPSSDPSRAYQERLALVAIDAMGKPSVANDKTIAQLADEAWDGVA
jgi:hypothetical protein